jgi:hypothetical protein
MSNGIQIGQPLEELPKITRGGDESGVWVDRLEPAIENPGKWVAVFGPVDNPHPTVNNLRRGAAAGVVPNDYEFAGRTFEVADEDGDPLLDDDGEPIREGYVFARLLTDEQKAERDAKAAEAESEVAEEEATEAEASLV